MLPQTAFAQWRYFSLIECFGLLAYWVYVRERSTRWESATLLTLRGCSSGYTSWIVLVWANWTVSTVCRRPHAESWTGLAGRCPPSGCPVMTGCSLWWWPTAVAWSWTAGTPYSIPSSNRSPAARLSSWNLCWTSDDCCVFRTFSEPKTDWVVEYTWNKKNTTARMKRCRRTVLQTNNTLRKCKSISKFVREYFNKTNIFYV